MSRIAQYVRFLGFVFAILSLTHGYLWFRLVASPVIAPPYATVLSVALVLLALTVPLTFLLRHADAPLSRLIRGVGFGWMGVFFFLFVGLLAGEVVRWAALPFGVSGVALSRAIATVVAAAAGVLAVASLLGARRLVVKDVGVQLKRLPAELNGLVVVQISDVHIGPTLKRPFVEKLVAKINALNPDVIAITGDLADGDFESLRPNLAPLGDLRARHGVYFVTGNHEYFGETVALLAELERLGVRVLRNERVTVGAGAATIDLAGVDDFMGRILPGHGPNFEKALGARDPSREVVLLVHQPKAAPIAAKYGVGLVLAGHTHAGQIWPFNHLVKLDQPYLRGLIRIAEDTQLYVSAGTGFWGPPMRLGTVAEITRIRLQRPAEA